MPFKLVCVHPFKDFVRGQEITDQDAVKRLMVDRDHHFVRVAMPAAPKVAAPTPASAPKA